MLGRGLSEEVGRCPAGLLLTVRGLLGCYLNPRTGDPADWWQRWDKWPTAPQPRVRPVMGLVPAPGFCPKQMVYLLSLVSGSVQPLSERLMICGGGCVPGGTQGLELGTSGS